MLINDLYTNKTPAVAEAIGDLGSSRDRGKSVRKWRKQRGLDEQGPTDVSRRGFLRGLAAFAASAAVPAPVVKLLSTPAGVATLPVAAGVALLKGIQDHLDQFDPEDDDDYHEAWENMADELGFENNDDGDSAHAQLADLVNLNRQNPELAAAQLIKHIQSGAGVNPEDVKSSFVARADDPSDWRYQRNQQDAKGVEIAQQLRAASLRWRNKDDDDDDDDYYDAGSNQIISTLLGHAADKFELDINDGIKLWRQLAAHSGREGFDDAQEEIYLTLQDHGINPEHAYKATSGAADDVSDLAKVARLAGVAKGVGSSDNQAAASTIKNMGPVQYAKDTLALPAPAKPEFDLAPDLKQKEKVPSKQSLREKITVVRDPAQATGIQQTGGITRGSVYSSGKPLPQSVQQKLDGNPNTGRAVDAKGRTQQQWMQLVKVNFPNAKIMQSKMIDGLCQAILPDGRKLSWIKVDNQSTEIDEASWNPIDGADYPVDLTGREMVTGPSDQKWQAMVNYYHDDGLVRRALADLDSKNSRTGNIQYVATIDPGHRAGHAGKHQTKYFKSKEEAYRYAETMNVRITSIDKLDQDQVDPPVTYNVILGIGEHRRMFKLTFASNALAQKWAHDNRNVVKIQWNDQRSEYSPPTTPRVDPEKADVSEAQTDYQRRRQRERDVDAGKPVKPEPRNPQNDYFARRKKEKEQGVDESWKSALGGAALAGSMALGGAAAQAQNAPSGEDFLPAIVAHVTFKVNGNTVTKDINLGTSFKSPGQASAALEKFLKSKGIKFYEFNLERVSDTEYNNNYLDKTPLTDKGNPAAYHTANKGYTPSDNTAGDYMVKEVSLGDYRKKATVNKAVAQTNRFFDRDDAAKVAAADQTIAKREKGMARADARVKPYTPPVHDAEKQQRDLTAKYPNIDQLVADAERNRDPYYDRAEGNAYYDGREAEQNYQKLKQIQRVIQGLNESLKRTQP